jgi:hypothetical protein
MHYRERLCEMNVGVVRTSYDSKIYAPNVLIAQQKDIVKLTDGVQEGYRNRSRTETTKVRGSAYVAEGKFSHTKKSNPSA